MKREEWRSSKSNLSLEEQARAYGLIPVAAKDAGMYSGSIHWYLDEATGKLLRTTGYHSSGFGYSCFSVYFNRLEEDSWDSIPTYIKLPEEIKKIALA